MNRRSLDVEELQVVYRDAQMIAINKPVGWMVHRGWDQNEPSIADTIRALTGRHVYPVHRLDRATSGLLIFALSLRMARDLNALFAQRLMRKRYLALVIGEAEVQGVIARPLTRNAKSKGKLGPLLPSTSIFRRICYLDDAEASLVEVVPITGRQHQIRRHMRFAGAPLLGDKRYGHRRANLQHRINYGVHRLALHALSLSFLHPATAAPLHLMAPLPDDLLKTFEKMDVPESTLQSLFETPDFSWVEDCVQILADWKEKGIDPEKMSALPFLSLRHEQRRLLSCLEQATPRDLK